MRKSNQLLGSLILLRSCFETAAMSIYINLKISALVDGTTSFAEFNTTIRCLLEGSKLSDSHTKAINILTVLGHCDKRYPGILAEYNRLSEIAHPNSMGMLNGYSTFDEQEYVSIMKNQFTQEEWTQIVEHDILACMMMFEHEYNDVFPKLFERLENWLETNSPKLEKEAQLTDTNLNLSN